MITLAYPLVKPVIVVEDVRIASIEDIAAMKLNAIAGNGTRLKDFVDIAYLSSCLTLSQMVEAYEIKYATRNPTAAVKSLDYHNDINFSETIELLGRDNTWDGISKN